MLRSVMVGGVWNGFLSVRVSSVSTPVETVAKNMRQHTKTVKARHPHAVSNLS